MSYDVLPHFKGLSIDQLAVSRFDPHFNRKGNAIVANAIFQFLTDRRTLE